MPKSLRASRQRFVHAPIERVWSVVGDFGHEAQWARKIRQSTRNTSTVEVGTFRTLKLAKPLMGRDQVEEVIIAIEPGRMLAYRLHGNAGPFASAESHWRLREDGRGTIVEVEGRFVPRSAILGFLVGGAAKVAIKRTLDGTLRELAEFAEGGENHAAALGISPES